MKTIGFVLLGVSLSIGSSWAQALRGTFYSLELGWTQEQFEFNGNRFVYTVSDCQSQTVATGTFVVSTDRLVLYCDKAADTTAVLVTFPCASTSKKPTFCFRVVDKLSGLPLAGVSISSCASQPKIVGTLTNAAGEANLTYLPPPGDSLCVRRTFCRTTYLPLRSTKSQRFTLVLDAYKHFPPGGTLTFQIKDVRPHSFAYKLYSGSSNDLLVTYSHCSQVIAKHRNRQQ